MKRFFAAPLAIAAIVAAHSASAADLALMPAKAPAYIASAYNWTGFYLGVHGGYGWGSKDWTRIAGSGGQQGNGTVRSFDIDGFLAGGQIGFNYQFGSWVAGVEGDVSWTNIGGGFVGANNNGPASWNTDLKWMSTLTGRIGYAFDNVLLYAKGGVAWAGEDHTHPATGGQQQAFLYTGSETRTGWTVGAGVEYGFFQNWSAKIEYGYLDFGAREITLNEPSGRFVTFDIDQRVHVFKFGINYRFGGAGPVVANN